MSASNLATWQSQFKQGGTDHYGYGSEAYGGWVYHNLEDNPYALPRNPFCHESQPHFSYNLALLRIADYLGTIAFAISGTITAAACGMNVNGCLFIATCTAIGGGTLRDTVLLSRPAFWLVEIEYYST